MYYYFIKNDIAMMSKEKPDEPYIEMKRAIPIPNEFGYTAKLNVDISSNKIWYELIENDKHILENKLKSLKEQLQETNDVTLQFLEGELSLTEFAEIKIQRSLLRNQIKELKERLNF